MLRTLRSFITAQAIFATLCIAALAFAAPAWSQSGLTIATTPSGLSLPVDVAAAQGFFRAENLDVKLVDCSSGPACMKLLFERRADLVTVSELPVVTASFERNDFAIVSTVASATGNIRLLGRRSAGISTPSDLAGKRVGVILGTSSHYYLDAFLLFHGIDPKQIQTVPVTSEALASAVENRQVDAVSAYVRHTGLVLKLLGPDAVMLDDTRIYSETYNLVAEKQTLANRAPEVQKVLRALARAERFIAERPQQAKEQLLTRLPVDRAFIDSVFPSFTYRLGLSQSLIAAMEGESRWAIREGHIRPGLKSPNYLDFIDPAPLRAAVPDALSK